jgi:methylmalonyl-CoA epimerase
MLSNVSLAPEVASLLASRAEGIDHVGIAVRDLEKALPFYSDILGLTVSERRQTVGEKTGMVSAVLTGGPVTFVLVQGTSPESQVNRFIERHGAGVQHIAVRVRGLAGVMEDLQVRGLEFITRLIKSKGLHQAFAVRDPDSGIMLELIERVGEEDGFDDDNVAELFRQMEESEHF